MKVCQILQYVLFYEDSFHIDKYLKIFVYCSVKISLGMWWKAWDCCVRDRKEVSYYLMFEVWSLMVINGEAVTRKVEFVEAF